MALMLKRETHGILTSSVSLCRIWDRSRLFPCWIGVRKGLNVQSKQCSTFRNVTAARDLLLDTQRHICVMRKEYP